MRVKEGTDDSDAETLDLDWRSHGLPGKYGHPVSGRVISFFLLFLQRKEALLSFSKNNRDLNVNFSDPPLCSEVQRFPEAGKICGGLPRPLAGRGYWLENIGL